MTVKFRTKTLQLLLVALTIPTAACADSTAKPQANISMEKNAPKLAYILEKTATPTKWDPAGAAVVNFKHCVQRPSGNEATIKATYQLYLDEIRFDLEYAAAAKANNFKVSSPTVKLHSASLVGACPSGAKATCDGGNVSEHYYTDAGWVLDKFKKSCGYNTSDTWSVSK